MNEESSQDQSLLDKLYETIEMHFEDEHFGVSELAREMGMSRSQLHRRLQSIRSLSASQIIREYRLNKAKEMLQKNVANVSEIAYKVGFGSPSYFITCFHDLYGFPPGEASNRYNSLDKSKKKSNRRLIFFVSIGSIFFLVLSILIFLRVNSSETTELKKCIVVLPFDNLSNDPNQDYFSDGIAENIRNRLSQLDDIRVISMTSSKLYKSREVSIRQIGRELDADYILEGSVLKDGNRIRIIVQLIESKSDIHKWANSYDRELSDILNIQNEIAVNISGELKVNLSETEYSSLKEIKEVNPYLYSNFLKANDLSYQYFEKNDSNYNNQAIKLLYQIISTDPTFVEAYIDLAEALSNTKYYNLNRYEVIGSDSIIKLVDAAINLNPEYPKSYFFLAEHYCNINDSEKEIKNLRKVIELDPNNYRSMFRLGNTLLLERNFKEGILMLFNAIKIEPVIILPNYVDLYKMYNIGYALYQLQLNEEAELVFKKMIELDSQGTCNSRAYQLLGGVNRELGDVNEALHYWKLYYKCDSTEFMRINHLAEIYMYYGYYTEADYYFNISFSQAKIYPYTDTTWFYPHMAYLNFQLGKDSEAIRLLENFIRLNERHFDKVSEWNQWKVYNEAQAYAQTVDKQKAIELLKSLPYIGSFNKGIPMDPLLNSLKDEEEFQELVSRMISESETIRKIAMSNNIQKEVEWLMDRWDLAKYEVYK
jgi:TolB-like protein/AraC-like DNA-binding protein/cytochrome c-type biogenesis protein CcmH/NrfG